MKKRIISLILVFALLALCGCAAVEEKSQVSESASSPVSVSAPVTADTMSAEAPAEAEPAETQLLPGLQADKDYLKPADPGANCEEERSQSDDASSKGGKGNPSPSPVPEKEELKQDVVVLCTNDVHCGVTGNIGYDGLSAYKKQLEADGKYVILVDSGDAIQGDLIGSISKGSNIIKIMNAVGYDVATIGNHEFDYTVPTLLKLTDEADFPYVSANFMDLKANKTVFEPYEMIEVDGVDIAFVGISTPDTITSSVPVFFQDGNGNYIYNFCNDSTFDLLYDAVQDAVDDAIADGADYVIALSHIGTERSESISGEISSQMLIAATTGIDVVFDGHSHSIVDSVTVKNANGEDVILSQGGTKLECFGQLTISKEGSLSCKLVSEVNGKDESITAIINDITGEYEAILGTTVAHSDFDLTIVEPGTDPAVRIVRTFETNLADLVTDSFRIICGADIGLQNGGGVRVSIKAGDISYKDLMAVLPFNNEICVIEATGTQIVDALEFSARKSPAENGGFLQVSGITFEINTSIPSSAKLDENGMLTGFEGDYRVKNVKVGGVPIDLNKTYTVAGPAYVLVNGGDGNTAFAGCKVIKDHFALDSEMLISYVVDTLGGVIPNTYADPHGEGRIKIISE